MTSDLLTPRTCELPVLTVAATRAAEQAAYRDMSSFTLMSRAGEAFWHWANSIVGPQQRPWLILAGTGNNGGDAFVVARLAHAAGVRVAVYASGPTGEAAPDAARARAELQAAGVTIQPTEALQSVHPSNWACIVDGLLGIGVRSAPTGEVARLVRLVNEAAHPLTLAIDIPSGLDADTGHAPEPCVIASHTLTMIACKPGLLTGSGPDHAGSLRVAPLGLALPGRPVAEPAAEADRPATGTMRFMAMADADLTAWWPKRRLNSHKGQHGDVVIWGGDAGMAGAAILAGRAAVMTGAGRVFVSLLDGPQAPGYDPIQPEMMLRPADSMKNQGGVWVMGPGAGQSEATLELLRKTIRYWHEAPAHAPKVVVLDADVLNLIAADPALAIKLQSLPLIRIMTPHPLEAGRLLSRNAAAVQANRPEVAAALARQFDAIVVLKGMGTLVSDGQRTLVNLSGGPALASGGTGDVLAGTIGALTAQCLGSRAGATAHESAWQAACLGTFLHGATCDRLPGETIAPMLLCASELPARIRDICHFALKGA